MGRSGHAYLGCSSPLSQRGGQHRGCLSAFPSCPPAHTHTHSSLRPFRALGDSRTCVSTRHGFGFLLLLHSPPLPLGADPHTHRGFAAGGEEPSGLLRASLGMSTPFLSDTTTAPQTPHSALRPEHRIIGQDCCKQHPSSLFKILFGDLNGEIRNAFHR